MEVKAYFPKSKEPLMSKTLGVGIVGCGFVGYGAHVPAFSSMPGAKLVAIADADQNRREKITKKYGVQTTYADYAELCRGSGGAIGRGLGPHAAARQSHAGRDQGRQACDLRNAAGRDLAEADEMIDAAKKAGVLLMPSLNFHFTPNYVKAKELLDKGAVGTPTFLMYREFIPAKDLAKQWPPHSWMWKMEESGGPLYTLAVWSIDLLRWLTRSEIVKVTRRHQVHGAAAVRRDVRLRRQRLAEVRQRHGRQPAIQCHGRRVVDGFGPGDHRRPERTSSAPWTTTPARCWPAIRPRANGR